MIISNNTCSFFGHRKITETEELKERVHKAVEDLITDKNVDTFLFGNKSQFNSLCYEVVSILKEKYPHIKRIYVRAAFADIHESYRNHLLKGYEDTYFQEKMRRAGKASYVERNYEMINNSKFCIVYYNKNYLPSRRRSSAKDFFDYQPNSGTKLAYTYAKRKGLSIINVFG